MDRTPVLIFTHSEIEDHCRRGGGRIVRAREVVQDHVKIESYKFLGPCSCEPTAVVSAGTRPTQLNQTKPSMELWKWAAEPNLG